METYIQRLRAKVGHELLLMASVTIAVYDDQDRILLVRHAEGDVWVLPGGGVEPPESLADAAVREMWEETGLRVQLKHVFGVYSGPEFLVTYKNQDQVTYQMIVFEAQVAGGVLRANGEETKAVAYLSQTEMAALPMPAWMHAILPDLFAPRLRTNFQPPTWQVPLDGVRKGGMSDYVRQLRQKVGNDLVLTPSVLGLIFDEQGRLLLQKRADNGRWAGPAGAIDPNEPPSSAIVREAWEETGVLIEPTRVIAIFGGAAFSHSFPGGDQIVNYGVVFAGRFVSGQPTPDGIESTAVDLFPLTALPTELMSPRWRKLIAIATENRDFADFDAASWQPSA
ncbi:MAG: NUDIX domain-containing protein [Chloroflexi bacterium]|nr:NUDIX domain-containing protein [Chloroflexota bacterium]